MVRATVTLALLASSYARASWTMPQAGFASLTHYELGPDAVAACGCVSESSKYPTAALSTMAFGSSRAFGPGCGRCFKLSLMNTFLSSPPFYPTVTPPSVVVKVTDLCPGISDWCKATQDKPNPAGHYINFDLAWPSRAIPDDFFPNDEQYYGYKDFGVWNISYEAVSCASSWAGGRDQSALGSVPAIAEGGCCPADPDVSGVVCPSFSDVHGDVPNTASTGAAQALQFPGALGWVASTTALALWLNAS